jgi:hypothetical protein
MHFTHVKLPVSAAATLRNCPIHTVSAFALMISPVYVYMRRNKKFVAVKAPLDFFTPEELAQLLPFESFFLPEFIDSALLFRETARHIKALIQWDPEKKIAAQDLLSREVALPPAPYEISDAVLRMVAPLWGNRSAIEPFFVTIFSNEICELLPADILRIAREKSVDRFECALFRSSWAVFLALHLGYYSLDFINNLRNQVFFESMQGEEGSYTFGERDELLSYVWLTVKSSQTQLFDAQLFKGTSSRVTQKLAARLKRIQDHFPATLKANDCSIFGPRGFVDV